MATTTENVVVNLKVTVEGSDNVAVAFEKQAKAIEQSNFSLGSAIKSIGTYAAAFLAIRGVLIAFNIIQGRTNTLFGVAAAAAGTFAKVVFTNVIPALRSLLATIGILLPVILAIVAAFKAFDVVMKNTITGSKLMTLSMEVMQGVGRALTDSITQIAKAMLLWAAGEPRKAIEELAKVFDSLNKSIVVVAQNVVRLQQETINTDLAFFENIASLRNALTLVTKELESQTLTSKEKIGLLTQQEGIQQNIFTLEKDQLDVELRTLENEQKKLKVGGEDYLLAQVEIEKVKSRIETIDFKATQLSDDLLITTMAITAEIIEQNRLREEERIKEAPEVVLDDETDEFAAKKKSARTLAEFLADINAEIVAENKAANELILEDEEETTDKITEKQAQAARDRIFFKKHEEEIKGNLLAAGFELAAGLAGENFRAQQAIAVAGAVVSTARGIAKALELGFPASAIVGATVAITGAAQIATILNASPGTTGGIATPAFPSTADIEASARIGPQDNTTPTFFANNSSTRTVQQPVLVVEDLTTVTGRIAVTNQRSSL